MGLKDYTPATETIQLPGDDSFVVRGLALRDISALLQLHYDTAEKLFDKYVTAEATSIALAASPDVEVPAFAASIGGTRAVIMDALKTAPRMIADLIACAADEPDATENILRLPTGIQVSAVEGIIRLTLEAEGGLEKMLETVTKLTTSLAGLGGDRSP